jgi:hypothetical protein
MLLLPGNWSQHRTRSKHHVTQIPHNDFRQPLSIGGGRNRPFCRTRCGWQSVHTRAAHDRPLLSYVQQASGHDLRAWAHLGLPPPNVQFDFWIADADTECPAKNVKVTWLYQIADKTTKVSVKTVLGSTTLPQVFQNTQLHSNGTQHLPQGRKRNDNPFLVGPKLQHQRAARAHRSGRSLLNLRVAWMLDLSRRV